MPSMNEAGKNITTLQDMQKGVENAYGEAHPFPFVDTPGQSRIPIVKGGFAAYQ